MVFPPCSRCTCFIFGGLCSTESERRRIEQSALTKYPSLLLRHYHPTYFRFTKKPDPYTPFTTSIHTLNLALGEIVCICMCICEGVCVHAPLCVLACVSVRVCVCPVDWVMSMKGVNGIWPCALCFMRWAGFNDSVTSKWALICSTAAAPHWSTRAFWSHTGRFSY